MLMGIWFLQKYHWWTEQNVLLKYKENQSINWNQVQVHKSIQNTSVGKQISGMWLL